MNGINNSERTTGDIVAFALIFFSFIGGAAGLVIGSAAIMVVAFILMFLSLIYFRFAS